MNKIRTVIVDDEKKAREGLQTLLSEDHELIITRTCKDGVEAIEFLENEGCDLLLLDIQMPAVNGFEVLQSLEKPPYTIFITAYDQYALKAFEHHALDYLLKPFTNQRFFEAMDRAKGIIKNGRSDSSEKLDRLLEYLQADKQEQTLVHSSSVNQNRLVIKCNGKIILLNTEEIEWIEADDYYIKINLVNKQYLIRESLKGILDRLPASSFMRVHKSAIINTQAISHLEHLQNTEYMLTLSSGAQVKVSRNYRKSLDTFLENL